MSYMYEPPSILDTYKSEKTGDNEELIYKNFLLQRLAHTDIESISIENADKAIASAISEKENKIPYIIELEYIRDKEFKKYLQENFSGLASKLDIQAENNKNSEVYNSFYQYFINIKDQGYRFAGFITEKQVVFQRTKEDYITDINNPEGNNNHDTLAQMYCEKMNISKTNPSKDNVVIMGDPHLDSNVWYFDFPNNDLSYSQYLFLTDCVNAYEQAKNDMDENDRDILEKKFESPIKGDIISELKTSKEKGFESRPINSGEVILGKTHTKEEIKKQISYDFGKRHNNVYTIGMYIEDSFFCEIFHELLPNGKKIEEVWAQMNDLIYDGLLDLCADTKEFIIGERRV